MTKRVSQGSNRRNAAEAVLTRESRAVTRPGFGADFNPYSEELIDRIVAEWGEVVPAQDSAAREIAATVARLAVLFQMDCARVLAGYRLSNTEFHLLGGLRRSGGPPYRRSPSELIPRYVPVTSGGLSGVMSRLERRGLVQRRQDPSDGRGVLVELTEPGRHLIEEAMKALTRREALMTANLKRSERRQAAQLLRSLLRAANAGFGAAPLD